MNFELARFNMVEQQVRPWEVLDPTVLRLMREVPREAFVPPAHRDLAYADLNLPLPEGQVMMQPRVEARMLQALQVSPADRVLEIGTGSGYVTALLSRMAREVVSVEIHRILHDEARETLARDGRRNITLEYGDARDGWPLRAPYDVIAVTGSLPEAHALLSGQLTPGGRLFAVVGNAPAMQALLVTRTPEGGLATESLFETVLPPLAGAERPQRFEF